MAEDATGGVGEEVYEVEKNTYEEVVEEEGVHTKIGLTYQM